MISPPPPGDINNVLRPHCTVYNITWQGGAVWLELDWVQLFCSYSERFVHISRSYHSQYWRQTMFKLNSYRFYNKYKFRLKDLVVEKDNIWTVEWRCNLMCEEKIDKIKIKIDNEFCRFPARLCRKYPQVSILIVAIRNSVEPQDWSQFSLKLKIKSRLNFKEKI